MTRPLTPAQQALVQLGEHCAGCSTCKPEWHGGVAVHQRCAVADRLFEQYRQRRRAAVRS